MIEFNLSDEVSLSNISTNLENNYGINITNNTTNLININSNNSIIGYNASVDSGSGNNRIAIGNNCIGEYDNTASIGNTNTEAFIPYNNNANLGNGIKSWIIKPLRLDYLSIDIDSGTITIPDGVSVVYLNQGTQSSTFTLNAPSDVINGQVLYVRNESGENTTGLVTTNNSSNTFIRVADDWVAF